MAPIKQLFPGDSQIVAFDYTNAMPIGSTAITGGTLEAHEWVEGAPGEDVTEGFLESSSGSVSGYQLRFRYNEITTEMIGKIYRVKSETTFNDGQTRVDRVLFQIVEG